ncbi:MAG: DUF547 domain-containing protein [Vicinamibacterales bacterium]|nr:DUF547 domain-containing protein [Vicinamibacterales bacterium]
MRLIRLFSLALVAGAVLLLMRALPFERLMGLAQAWIDGLGVAGPLALGALYVAAALLFVPGSLLTLAAGAAYGLVLGTVIVSVASTTAVALAFLIARYAARDRVQRMVAASPKLAAVDEAIGAEGWKIVALLRLSPAVPFNLQNYLYGVTAVGFWPAVAASWLAMLPGTFMYVYLGSIGRTAAAGAATSPAEWALRAIGLLATIAVTVYVARLASAAIRTRTKIDQRDAPVQPAGGAGGDDTSPAPASAAATVGFAALALGLMALALWSLANPAAVRARAERALGLPPTVASTEAYEARDDGPSFDHATFDALLRAHVDPDGYVDYAGLQREAGQLDAYLAQLAGAPFDALGRDEKLALLINAYNAFTLRLILDHYPVASIRDIPAADRWDAARWQVGRHTWSLNQIEHQEVRPNFAEPRIHFALVCAAVGCPPLRAEAYTADRLEAQLADQTGYVHTHPRWVQVDADGRTVRLTALYDWYGGDFTQHAPTVLDYAARVAPDVRMVMEGSAPPAVRWLDYDWRLNSREHRPETTTR